MRFNTIFKNFQQKFLIDFFLFSITRSIHIICKIVKHTKSVYLKFWAGSDIFR